MSTGWAWRGMLHREGRLSSLPRGDAMLDFDRTDPNRYCLQDCKVSECVEFRQTECRRRLTLSDASETSLMGHGVEEGRCMNMELSRRQFMKGAGAGMAGTTLGAFGFGGVEAAYAAAI